MTNGEFSIDFFGWEWYYSPMGSKHYIISFVEDEFVKQTRITRHSKPEGVLESERILPDSWTKMVHSYWWYTNYPDYGPDFSESYAYSLLDELIDMSDEDIDRWILMYQLDGDKT